MEVQIFRDYDYGDTAQVVDGVNKWLKANPNITIKNILQSLAPKTFVITIWFVRTQEVA